MPSLDLPDIALYYEQHGGGVPVLLIAGFGSDNASWIPLLPHMGSDLCLICPDNRTTGRTTPWDAPTDVATNANDCLALLDALGLEQAHVIGHSMGGLIGMDLATRHPERIASLSLLAIAPLRSPRNQALFEALIAIRRSNAPPDTWLRAFYPWLFRPQIFDHPHLIDAAASTALAYPFGQSVDAMALQLGALKGYDPSSVSVSCPVQAVLGSEDLLIQEAPARAALKTLPGIEIHRLEGAAHAVHWDAPVEVAEMIRTFLAAHPI